MGDPKENEFERAAAKHDRQGMLGELWGFIKENKKWWLVPLLVTLVGFGVLVFLSTGSGFAPFIYTLF